jgi:quinol monooxygenase YgiN
VIQLQLRLTAPAGRSQETIQALRSIMLPVQLERGEAHTRLYEEVGNSGHFCYVEEWPGVEDLVAQVRSPRFARMLALMETAAEAPALELRFVSEVRGLDYIGELRDAPRRGTDD